MDNGLTDLSRRKPPEVAEALEALRPIMEAGYDLFPLRVGTKIPAHTGWQERDYSAFHWPEWMRVGGNAGVRLRASDLVIDCDPRNYAAGDDPLARLSGDVGADLSIAPAVITGGGGRHLYFAKPPDVRVVGKLATYEGIDFKSVGGFVVAPGSIHPDTGLEYRADPQAMPLDLIDPAPAALLDLIRKPDRPAARSAAMAGALEPERLAVLLEALDVADYRGHGDWFGLMASCHHLTGGDGEDVFIEWSTEDRKYADHDEVIRARWRSLDAGKAGGITGATLFKALRDRGRSDLIPLQVLDPADEFDDEAPLDLTGFEDGEVLDPYADAEIIDD